MRFRVQGSRFKEPANSEEGYLLLGAIVAIALVMIALSVAAVKVSFELRREREEESVQRANQYVRAIREYYLKFGRYPGSVDQLVNTNNIRFLRQKYVDPLTGKADYRLIIVGQNKTQPVGFFGQPLSGLQGAGPGAGAGTGTQASGTTNGAGGNSANSAGGIGANTARTGNGIGGSTATAGFGGAQSNGPGSTAALGSTPATGTTAGTQTTATSSSSTTGSGEPGSSLGPIMGVGSSATGAAAIAVNGQTTYETWEFLYDPRVERLRQAGQLNSGASSASGNGNPAGLGGAPQSGTTTTPGTGPNPAGGNTQPGGAPTNGAPPTQP